MAECHEVTINGLANVDEDDQSLYTVTIVPPEPGDYLYTYAWSAPGAVIATPTAESTLITFPNPGQIAVTVVVSLALSAYPTGLPVSPPRPFSDANIRITEIQMQDWASFGIASHVNLDQASLRYEHPLITWSQASALTTYYEDLKARGAPVILPDDVWIGLTGDMLTTARQDATGREWWFAEPPVWTRSQKPDLVTVTIRVTARKPAVSTVQDRPLLGVAISGPGQFAAPGSATYQATVDGPTDIVTYTYLWEATGANFDDATLQAPLITFPGSGLYDVKVTATGGGDSVTTTMEVDVQ